MLGVTVGRPCRGFLAAVLIVAFLVGINAIPDAAPMEITPYLQAVTTNSIYVLVECDAKDPVKVDYGTTASYGASALTESTEETTAKTYVHNVKLAGLKPNTVYHYRVSRQGAVSADYTFRTAVGPGTPFRFAWMADCRSGTTVHDEIAALIDKAAPVFSLYGGDLCSDPTYYVFKNEFFRPNELALIAKVPFFNAVGNHEDWDVNTKAFTQAPASASGTQDYYSFDYGDLHVLVLNNELGTYAGSPQYNFALSDLSTTKRTWKVVIAHRPAYSYSNKHGGDPDMAVMTKNIFEPCKVNMVLSGHDHLYQHNLVNGIHHMVIGSAGATLYDPTTSPYTIKSAKDYNFAIVDVTPTTFEMTVYNNKGTILEKIGLTKGGPATGVSTAPVSAPVPPGPAAAPAAPAATAKKTLDVVRNDKVKIDGDLADWKNAKWGTILPDPVNSLKKVVTDPADASMEFSVQWDENNIYFAGKGIDNDLFVNTLTDSNAWDGDAIEFCVSFRPAEALMVYQESDYKFILAKTTKGDQLWATNKNVAGTIDAPAKDGEIVIKKTGDKTYVIEAKIPKSNFVAAAKYAAGDKIGLQIALDDADRDVKAGKRKEQLIWEGQAVNTNCPAFWGIGVLVK